MDKEKIIKAINTYYTRDCTVGDIEELLEMYCRDRGKREEDIERLVRIVTLFPTIHNMIQYAISWYAKELNLTIINKIENNQLIPFKIL